MDITGAAVFLVGTLLIGLGFCVMAAMMLFLNNIFSKYWKPITWRINDMFVEYQPLPVKKTTEPVEKDK